MRFRASKLAEAIGASLAGDDVMLTGADFDSRTIRPGQLFVPIVAERDGHDFAADAVAAGAPAYLTDRGPLGDVEATAIQVKDTATALMEAAAWARSRSDAAVIGVTGSVGKTSTKDLAAAALATAFVVTANQRSFNNEQGLPVTILNADDRSEAMVLEMGMRGFGEIARLCDVAQPRIGVVTNVAAAHTERVGGLDGVARAKRELVESLGPSGTAILNADDERVEAMATHTEAGVLRFGTATTADVHITGLELDDLARARFEARTPWGQSRVSLAVAGAHMAFNAAAAIAAAGVVGAPFEAVVESLATTGISQHRMDARRTASGGVVIDDAYNANPTSMRAALDALAAMEGERRIAVLGLMAELDDPPAAHRAIADHMRSLGIELIAVGTDLYGVAPVDDPIAALGELGADDVVLFKASRVAGLDRFADQLP